ARKHTLTVRRLPAVGEEALFLISLIECILVASTRLCTMSWLKEYKHFQLRGRENFSKYVRIELKLLAAEWKVILPCVVMQYVHGIFHNWAYYIQGHKLSVEQRFPLYDLGFELMPELSEKNAHWSEYLVFGAVFAPAIALVVSIPLFRQNPRKPRYMVIILKRVLLHLSIALVSAPMTSHVVKERSPYTSSYIHQAFRIISFMVTALPGPARHCRPVLNQECVANNPGNPTLCVVPNPYFKPPTKSEFFTNMDALNGCGDLMFSSHTIYTLSFILTVSKYWPHKWLVGIMVCVQIAIAFLIVAARKHYSLDVFSALYIVPLLWFTQEAYLKDINNKDVEITPGTIKQFYAIDESEYEELQSAIYGEAVEDNIEKYKHFQLRDKENFLRYVRIELQLLMAEWKVLLPCTIFQYVHGIFHNWAYYIQGHMLSIEQRFPLYDLGFKLMPELKEKDSHWSEYLVFGGVFAPAILLVLSIPVFRQNPRKPRFMVIILKRVLLHLSIALSFRIISFMVTALPGPARHCRPMFDEKCLADNPGNPTLCVVPNPYFKPPTKSEFFTNMDALNGCGDLMFSSHTIYTLSFILTVSKYWPHKWLVGIMVCVQIAIAFLIVAARKHYSLDVFSALYIVPLLWFTQEAYLKDINNKDVEITPEAIREYYGIDVAEEIELQSTMYAEVVENSLESGVRVQTPGGKAVWSVYLVLWRTDELDIGNDEALGGDVGNHYRRMDH
ncbi:TPA: hypothetical protein N0F65_006921, partial [Lagenidium giganteum]